MITISVIINKILVIIIIMIIINASYEISINDFGRWRYLSLLLSPRNEAKAKAKARN